MADKSNDESFRETVNCSGFPLQIAVARLVRETQRKRGPWGEGWRVLYTEHAWRDADSGESGFLDLVLGNDSGSGMLAVECKRVREASWLFLSQDGGAEKRRHAKLWVVDTESGSSGWRDIPLDPASPECEFCVVHARKEAKRLAVDQVASQVVAATQSLAVEEEPYHRGKREYASVIVTTAKLHVCRFDPQSISLSTGELSDAEFVEVPHLRYRKQLSTRVSAVPATQGEEPRGWLAAAKEHTVFIVNVDGLESFLTEMVAQ